jgi:4-hydroxyphenylpyruvate dioxygenase
MATTNDEPLLTHVDNQLRFKSIDYVEFYVGNAYQAAHFYRNAFGFTPIAYAGLETGVRDKVSYVVEQRGIRLILTEALTPDSSIAEHVKRHGDGVKDIAFQVGDAVYAFEETVRRGAQPVIEPDVYEDNDGQVIKATVSAFGDTVHSFIQRLGYEGFSLPRFRGFSTPLATVPTGLKEIDHIAIAVAQGILDELVDFYQRVFGFGLLHEENVMTEYSGMNSKVVQDQSGIIKFPIVEPALGKRRSQIDEYLAFYRTPGVQHLATSTDNIYTTIQILQRNGVEFVRAPEAYYAMLANRLGDFSEDLDRVCELGIMVDCDDYGYMMQTFTKPLQSRPTFFFEIVQRKQARSFGGNNIKALFQAIEHEQALRGNL